MTVYDPKNNDTYDKIYSYSMERDVEMHMFKNDKAMSIARTHDGSAIRGDFSVESQLVAHNNVLHFETAKELGTGLKFVKSKDTRSLVPLSLMKRYNNKLDALLYTQKAPIFFNIETEKFVTCLDNRFLRDLKKYNCDQEFKQEINELVQSKQIKIVSSASNQQEQILLSYDSLENLYKDTSGIFTFVKEKYLQQLLNIYPNEDVIIIKYSLEENNDSYFRIDDKFNISPHAPKKNIFFNSKIQFEFLKARKISDVDYYIYKNDGSLYLHKSFHFNKEKQKSNINNIHSLFIGNENSLLIVPHTDQDWQKLKTLKGNIDSVFNDLDNLLKSQKAAVGLDKPITEIESFPMLMLGHETPKKNNI